MYVGLSGGSVSTGAASVPNNAWSHLAFVRTNGLLGCFVNGVFKNSAVIGSGVINYDAGAAVMIGRSAIDGYFNGYIDDFRITKGVCRYSLSNTVIDPGAFQPDLVWIKSRSASSNHKLTDSVRGATKALTITANVETTDTTGLTSFNSNGFTVGADTNYNNTGATYVAWQWKKASAAGFDIQAYTGTGAVQNISHSLGAVPTCMIVKSLTTASMDWFVYHVSLGNTSRVLLDFPSQSFTDTAWNNTTPTSSVFTIGNNAGVNTSGSSYISYLFAAIPGYSAFGSYVGNANPDGPFVYCGFKPRFIMLKNTTSSDNWIILDTARDPYNVSGDQLIPNTYAFESFTTTLDILSNGFKLRVSTAPNISANTYIYMAFAEAPFKYADAR